MARLSYPVVQKRPIEVLEEKEEVIPQSNKRLRMMEDEKSSRKARTVKPGRQAREKFAQSVNKKESSIPLTLFNPLSRSDSNLNLLSESHQLSGTRSNYNKGNHQRYQA